MLRDSNHRKAKAVRTLNEGGLRGGESGGSVNLWEGEFRWAGVKHDGIEPDANTCAELFNRDATEFR